MSGPQNRFKPHIQPKNSPLEPQKVKKDPRIKTKYKVGIEEMIENENCLTTWVQPKTVFESFPDIKNSPLGPQTVKTTPNWSQNQKSELK